MSGELGECSVCGGNATVLYPLLPREPKFCNEHHNPKDAGPFGCDFTGPDDFDIPDLLLDDEFQYDRDTFVWKDREGIKHPLNTIDDRYLQNIVNFLRRKPTAAQGGVVEYWLQSLIEFLEAEQRTRCLAESRK